MDRKDLKVIGIMTGNSLDAVDLATFSVGVVAGKIKSFVQIGFHTFPCSDSLRKEILALKESLKVSGGVVTPTIASSLTNASKSYHQEVNAAIDSVRAALPNDSIDLIGIHGQTLGHCPPSVAKAGQAPYTIQMGDGGVIADRQGVVTVSDFRSDDLLNGGEGAPFAPAFNALLAPALGVETAVFINAGNTSNIALIKSSTKDVLGWDCGPCNQFPDLLMREEQGGTVDKDGAIAKTGTVQKPLIERLWATSVVKQDGGNALEVAPPRSFDPQWYRLPSELRDRKISFSDRMRSAVAFSAYCVAHSLALAVRDGHAPDLVVLFGGGWKNPVLLAEFKELCSGRANYILAKHQELFAVLKKAIADGDQRIKIGEDVGLSSAGMEAGIFAFAAVQRILNQPFTKPSFTGCRSPTKCGATFIPQSGVVSAAIIDFGVKDERSLFKDSRLSRAAPTNR